MTKKVFLSHNSADKPAVEKLAEKIEAAGFQPWLDKWNLIPGDPWQPALEAALKECEICAVFLGANLAGPWQNEEMEFAINRRVHDKQFRVVPVLLPDTERGKRGEVPAFLSNVTWVEFESLDNEYDLKRLINSLHGLPTRPPKTTVVVGSCPYKGLESFNIDDADYFFGREALTDWLVADVKRMMASPTEPRFLAIVGASGSGKSSVARAGLLYELSQGAIPGSEEWLNIIVDHPGAEPLKAIFSAKDADKLGLPQNTVALEKEFIAPILANEEYKNKLNEQANLVLANQGNKRLLLFIDQFEEIFTTCHDVTHRKRFVDSLLHAARAPNGKIMIVITMRLDFLGRCVDHPELSGIISGGMELVDAMSDVELESAIIEPAARAGVEISASLVKTLIQDVRKQPGSLPLLEHVLKALWQQKTGAKISDADYTLGIKGIEGALSGHADKILTHQCGSPEQQKQVLALLTRLVHISDIATPETDTRIRYPINDAEYQLIRPFDHARLLLTTNVPVAKNKNEDHPTRIVEVAHEALIRHWPKLQDAIKDRQFVLWRERLANAATEWQQCNQPDSLLNGQKLQDAQHWLSLKKEELNNLERNYINSSIWSARKRVAIISSVILFPLALACGFFIWSANNFSSPKVGVYALLAKAGISWFWTPTMVQIPPDEHCSALDPCEFMMGSPEDDKDAGKDEKPAHLVRFTQSFAISQTEITFAQYEIFAYFINKEGGCLNKEANGEPHSIGAINDSGFGKGQHPVINVSWDDAQCYVQWLRRRFSKINYHLPTEAQWEYAIRANANPKNTYYWGGNDSKDFAWFNENANKQSHPVAQKKPNEFGLFDMSGNVWEWVQDCYAQDYKQAPQDGSAWEQGCQYRVLRGGSWDSLLDSLRSATRFWRYPGNRYDGIGFRLAQD
jgi:formylglycine-generating enzyme required for sulfatase activity